MKDDPVIYTIASVGALGLGMLLSDSTLLLIIFLLAAIALSVLGIRKSYDNNITKIICIIVAAIAGIYLIVSIILLLSWGSVRGQIQRQWSQ